MLYQSYYQSPIGQINIVASDVGIVNIYFCEDQNQPIKENEHTQQAIQELEEYFNKTRTQFSLSLDINGTNFQKQVWQYLLSIPYGTTQTYLQIANALNNKNAVRAVGNANRNNKILLVLPCHRVIGQNGNLVGYAGELWRKQWLLDFEHNSQQTTLF